MVRESSWSSGGTGQSDPSPFMSSDGGGTGRGHGGDNRNHGNRKTSRRQVILIVIAVMLVLGLIGQCSGGTGKESSSSDPSRTQSSSAVPTPSTSSADATQTPSESPSESQAVPAPVQSSATQATNGGDLAQTVLDELAVQDLASKAGYSRDQFGPAWSDVDHNGCDTRNDILKRDLANVTFKPNTHDCVVLTGTLDDPYTGKTIAFERGQETSKAVQIDHVVALSDAWQTGAQNLSEDQRLQLANDPYNLLAVDGPTNQEKSDSDAASWLPPNTAFDCEYVARQIGVKHKYSLWVTAGEKSAMQTVLSSCPTQSVPTDGGVSDGARAATQQAAAAQDSAAQGQATQSLTTQSPTTQNSAAQASGSGDSDVYYRNCKEVRAAGKAPLYAGQPGYRSGLDGDNDGVACEAKK